MSVYRATVRRVGFLVLVSLSAAAFAQASSNLPRPTPPDLSTKAKDGMCRAAAPGEVVVCGERERSPYRIDQTVLDATRSKEAANNPPHVQDRGAGVKECGSHSNPCGGSMVPILQPALRVASAIVKAVEGEDWREPFQNGPNDYDRYKDAREKEARGSVSVGISASSGNR